MQIFDRTATQRQAEVDHTGPRNEVGGGSAAHAATDRGSSLPLRQRVRLPRGGINDQRECSAALEVPFSNHGRRAVGHCARSRAQEVIITAATATGVMTFPGGGVLVRASASGSGCMRRPEA